MQIKVVFNKDFPLEVDTVFYQKLRGKEKIFIFKDGNYWTGEFKKVEPNVITVKTNKQLNK